MQFLTNNGNYENWPWLATFAFLHSLTNGNNNDFRRIPRDNLIIWGINCQLHFWNYVIPLQMATIITSGGSRETTPGGGWQRGTSVRGGGGGEGWYNNQHCCHFYHTGADEKVWGGGDEGWSLSLSLSSLTLSFFITRPKSAYGRQGLDWDCRARIQFGQVHFGAKTSRHQQGIQSINQCLFI